MLEIVGFAPRCQECCSCALCLLRTRPSAMLNFKCCCENELQIPCLGEPEHGPRRPALTATFQTGQGSQQRRLPSLQQLAPFRGMCHHLPRNSVLEAVHAHAVRGTAPPVASSRPCPARLELTIPGKRSATAKPSEVRTAKYSFIAFMIDSTGLKG